MNYNRTVEINPPKAATTRGCTVQQGHDDRKCVSPQAQSDATKRRVT